MSTDVDPKSISEKGSEEDEEEKLEDDDKSEESSQPEGNTLVRSVLCAWHKPHSCCSSMPAGKWHTGCHYGVWDGLHVAVPLPFHVSGG